MFLSPEDQKITEEYFLKGYIIRPVANPKALDSIRSHIVKLSRKKIGLNSEVESSYWLNSIHEQVSVKELNSFRMDIISGS